MTTSAATATNRADPALLKAGKVVMSGADLAGFAKGHPGRVEEAIDTAREVLNSMFRAESPARAFIRSKAASGAAPIGQGWGLCEALIKWAARGIDEYIERPERLLLQLAAQGPPQPFPEALKVQWLVNGLPAKFVKVIDQFDREHYTDLDALQAAIITEADILADKEAGAASSSVLDAAAAVESLQAKPHTQFRFE